MKSLEQQVLMRIKFINIGCMGKRTTGENISRMIPYKKVEEHAKTLLYIVWRYSLLSESMKTFLRATDI